MRRVDRAGGKGGEERREGKGWTLSPNAIAAGAHAQLGVKAKQAPIST